ARHCASLNGPQLFVWLHFTQQQTKTSPANLPISLHLNKHTPSWCHQCTLNLASVVCALPSSPSPKKPPIVCSSFPSNEGAIVHCPIRILYDILIFYFTTSDALLPVKLNG